MAIEGTGCTPEKIDELLRLMREGKNGETETIPLSIDIPDEVVQNPAVAIANSKFGWLFPVRTARAAFGDWLSVHAIDKLGQTEIKANNFMAKELREYHEATKELRGKFGKWGGISRETRESLMSAVEKVDAQGVYKGPPATFDDKVVDAAIKVRGLFNRLAKEHGIDDDLFINYYRPIVKQRTGGVFYGPALDNPLENAFRSRITPEQVSFYREIERKGMILDPDGTADASFMSYLRGIASAKIRKPVVEQLENDIVNPHFGVQWMRDLDGASKIVANDAVGHSLWKELVHNYFGGPTPLDKNLTMTLKSMANMFGKDADTRSLYKISHFATTLTYAGAMGSVIGGRPATIIRQMFQLVPSYAEFGAKYVAQGIQRTMTKGGIESIVAKNLVSSPFDGLADNITLASRMGQVIDVGSHAMLRMVGATDQYTRAVTAHSAAVKFEDYSARGILNKITGRREFKDEFQKLVSADKLDDAKDLYMRESVFNLQYLQGRANRPQVFRGALGNLVSTFMSYPLNTFEMLRIFAKRGVQDNDWLPMVRLMTVTGAAIYGGSEFLNADLRSAFTVGSIPHTLAFPKLGMDMFQSGASTVEWLVGDLFNIDETDFRRHQRFQNYGAFSRDMRMYAPGGLFFWEDLPRARDEGSIARMLALTPKAAAINEQAKQRRAEARQEAGGGSGVRPLATLGGLKGL